MADIRVEKMAAAAREIYSDELEVVEVHEKELIVRFK